MQTNTTAAAATLSILSSAGTGLAIIGATASTASTVSAVAFGVLSILLLSLSMASLWTWTITAYSKTSDTIDVGTYISDVGKTWVKTTAIVMQTIAQSLFQESVSALGIRLRRKIVGGADFTYSKT